MTVKKHEHVHQISVTVSLIHTSFRSYSHTLACTKPVHLNKPVFIGKFNLNGFAQTLDLDKIKHTVIDTTIKKRIKLITKK